MEKIKNIKHLLAEKKKLQQRKTELEKAIRYDWRDLKDSLKFTGIKEQFFNQAYSRGKEKKEEAGFFADGIAELAGKFVKNKTIKVEKKIAEWFEKLGAGLQK